MNKLGKKTYEITQTVEAFADKCADKAKCIYPACPGGAVDSSNRHMSENNNVYSIMARNYGQ